MAEAHIDSLIAEYSATYTEFVHASAMETQTALALKEAPEAVSETKLRDQIMLIRRHGGRLPVSDFTELAAIRKCAENNALRELAEAEHKKAIEALTTAQNAMAERFGKVVAEFKPQI
jgi:hypothetical protein